MHELDTIFSPESLAVIGASATPGKVGHDIFRNILRGEYTGVLYPVNPGAKSVLSVKAYPTVLDIPGQVDMAMIILPPKYALEAVGQCIEKGVKGLVIVSAGFREVGGEGREVEDKIVDMCRESGVRLIGPNCLGVINPVSSASLNASFATRMPEPGNISFISQSGALCTSVLDVAADRQFGFSKFISIGNKADVDELDLLEYLHQDPDTDVILMYIEELRRGAEFIQKVKEITSGPRRTPILAIKSGRTTAGASAASSHTGSLAGSEAVYDAIFEQSGIIRVDSINDLFDFAGVFTYKQQSRLGKVTRKLPAGNRVAIVTNAGGPGIVATDMTVSSGLQLAKFSDETIETLDSHLPSTANLNNPVDIIGDAAQERYEHALQAVIRDEGVDGAVVILTPQSMTNALATAEAVVKVARESTKPVICCFMGVVDVSKGVQYLQEQGYPVFRFPENAAKAFGVLYRFSKWINRQQLAEFTQDNDRQEAERIIRECLDQGKTSLGELDGLRLLQCYGFDVLPTELASSALKAGELAEGMGFPVVMKIVSPQILHKSDAGGVVVNVGDKQEAEQAFDTIMANAREYDSEATLEGVLVQKMAEKGQEVILGLNRYPIFGPLLMFGLGGIFVEVFKDVSFRLAPVGRNEARRMVRGIKGYKMLTGFRGQEKADVEKIEKLLVGLSDMALHHPQIQEMDINPLMVHAQGKGATVADCRIILEDVK
ncbi:acetate--CoA ligase alpha subunit [Desulfovermiculus halophilus]|jgi:acetyltransferase|uniref:acetate--CoA ligase alpha subunit n=1 Tax=Desulfovermiculus halophilus TaxID=339722 RepID=UPI000488F18E|nr:acetate--CoA ligase [Desulfovermiculus halophilus]